MPFFLLDLFIYFLCLLVRYRISGSSLLAAMDESSQVSSGDLDKEQADRSQVNRENLKENISSSQPGDD